MKSRDLIEALPAALGCVSRTSSRVRPSLSGLVGVVLVVAFAATPARAGLSDWWFGRPWEFIQAVGGIRVGSTTRASDGSVSIEIQCDVSGVQRITRDPELMNSAVGVRKMLAVVDGNRIEIAVRTGLREPSRCTPVELSHLDPGEYSVVYRGSDRIAYDLGSVVVH